MDNHTGSIAHSVWIFSRICNFISAGDALDQRHKCANDLSPFPWWDHGELLELWEGNIRNLQESEIIFIDNGSSLKTKQALKEFCQKYDIKLIRNEKNLGFAAANNQGIEIATGDYILHLNKYCRTIGLLDVGGGLYCSNL